MLDRSLTNSPIGGPCTTAGTVPFSLSVSVTIHNRKLSECTVTNVLSDIWYAGMLGFRYPVAALQMEEKARIYEMERRNQTAEKTVLAGRFRDRYRNVDQSVGKETVENNRSS